MTPAQKRAYRLADNQLALASSWDEAILADELRILDEELSFDIGVIGFETADLDRLRKTKEPQDEEEEVEEPLAGDLVVSRPGDIWHVGPHRILCGDARERASYQLLLGKDRLDMMFSDPPYNLKVKGHISGLGSVVHPEFAMASGEMSSPEFTDFLADGMRYPIEFSKPGALHYICMDWRHIREIMDASDRHYAEFKMLCVWVKDNGGMGAFYRSKHELVFIFKPDKYPHINNFKLGEKGRYRTNVWEYAGSNTFRAGRLEDLHCHPTCKSVKMVEDAILDATSRGGIVLDPYLGSGTSLIAAARAARRGFGIEIDGRYSDLSVRRLSKEIGAEARLGGGQPFDEVAADRGIDLVEKAK